LSAQFNPARFVNAALTARRHVGVEGTVMRKQNLRRWIRIAAVVSAAATAITGMGKLVGLAAGQYKVSQKGRQFHPGDLNLKRGETITIVNDDGDLRHHAYIDSDSFRFDSGDQEPGSKTDISFSAAGNFDVLCAIHPKMKLTVHVR
jgi:plastocyanin